MRLQAHLPGNEFVNVFYWPMEERPADLGPAWCPNSSSAVVRCFTNQVLPTKLKY